MNSYSEVWTGGESLDLYMVFGHEQYAEKPNKC